MTIIQEATMVKGKPFSFIVDKCEEDRKHPESEHHETAKNIMWAIERMLVYNDDKALQIGSTSDRRRAFYDTATPESVQNYIKSWLFIMFKGEHQVLDETFERVAQLIAEYEREMAA